MHTFVVNLEDDLSRRKHISEQLDAAGIAFEWLKAVRGSRLSTAARATHYDDKMAKWRQSRSLTPPEIGCALSHVKLYWTVASRNINRALVLEDDVIIPPFLPALLQELESLLPPEEPLVCLLSEARIRETSERRSLLGGQVAIGDYRSGFYSSSYIVTKAAAEILGNELYPVCDVADCWARLSRRGVVRLRAITPAVIHQAQAEFGSSTTRDIKVLLGQDPHSMLAYKVRRLRNVVWDQVSGLAIRAGLTSPRKPVRSGCNPADRLLD